MDLIQRNQFGFMILGMCNNFSFNIMLSAANDLMARISSNTTDSSKVTEKEELCNDMSTSAILLADIIPALCVQVIYPICLVKLATIFKLVVSLFLAAASYLVAGFSTDLPMIIIGACAASMAYGIGESTFLSSIQSYGPGSLAGWSIGTGCAGLTSALAYAIMRVVLPIQLTMILMLSVPLLMLCDYMFILIPIPASIASSELEQVKRSKLNSNRKLSSFEKSDRLDRISLSSENFDQDHCSKKLELPISIVNKTPIEKSTWQKLVCRLWFMANLSKYWVPIFIVYLSAYFINQGLIELCYFHDLSSLDKASQYRWLQVSYQLGSLLSRSSILYFRFKNLWLMAILQPLNVILFMGHASGSFLLPSFYLAVVLVFFEGSMTGFCYANTYYNMREEIIDPNRQRLSISIVVIFTSLGILIAAALALPTHERLCGLITGESTYDTAMTSAAIAAST